MRAQGKFSSASWDQNGSIEVRLRELSPQHTEMFRALEPGEDVFVCDLSGALESPQPSWLQQNLVETQAALEKVRAELAAVRNQLEAERREFKKRAAPRSPRFRVRAAPRSPRFRVRATGTMVSLLQQLDGETVECQSDDGARFFYRADELLATEYESQRVLDALAPLRVKSSWFDDDEPRYFLRGGVNPILIGPWLSGCCAECGRKRVDTRYVCDSCMRTPPYTSSTERFLAIQAACEEALNGTPPRRVPAPEKKTKPSDARFAGLDIDDPTDGGAK